MEPREGTHLLPIPCVKGATSPFLCVKNQAKRLSQPQAQPGPAPTHITLEDELFATSDLEQDTLPLFDLGLLHRLNLLHGQEALLWRPQRGNDEAGGQGWHRGLQSGNPAQPSLVLLPYRCLSLSPPLKPIGEQVEVTPLPLGEEGVAHLGHVAMHDAVFAKGII